MVLDILRRLFVAIIAVGMCAAVIVSVVYIFSYVDGLELGDTATTITDLAIIVFGILPASAGATYLAFNMLEYWWD